MPFSFPYFVSSLGSISERAEKHFFLEMCYTATVQVHKKKTLSISGEKATSLKAPSCHNQIENH